MTVAAFRAGASRRSRGAPAVAPARLQPPAPSVSGEGRQRPREGLAASPAPGPRQAWAGGRGLGEGPEGWRRVSVWAGRRLRRGPALGSCVSGRVGRSLAPFSPSLPAAAVPSAAPSSRRPGPRAGGWGRAAGTERRARGGGEA